MKIRRASLEKAVTEHQVNIYHKRNSKILANSMLKTKTLFVVGAGASKEFGLPTGAELVPQIIQKLSFRAEFGQTISDDRELCSALRREIDAGRTAHWEECLKASYDIKSGLPQATSIDQYLHIHQASNVVKLLGKLAIVRSILDAEKESLLRMEKKTIMTSGYVDYSEWPAYGPDLRNVEKKWIHTLFGMINQGIMVENLEDIFNNVSFVVFNYDRCIENYLYYSIQNLYSVSAQRAKEIMLKLSIIHPYGQVGLLPWQCTDGGHVSFGGEKKGIDTMAIVNQIRTFTESAEKRSGVAERISNEMINAETIVFLGFGYLPLNMELLATEQKIKAKNIFGTAYGESESNIQDMINELKLKFYNSPHLYAGIQSLEAAQTRIEIKNMECVKLLTDYRRSLCK